MKWTVQGRGRFFYGDSLCTVRIRGQPGKPLYVPSIPGCHLLTQKPVSMHFETKDIRNVALLGHSGSGKTTLAECMLYESGRIKRRGSIEDGNTVSDYTNIERERKNSIFSTLMHAHWKDAKINILDTPGLDDFVGEVIPALRVAATSVMLLNAKNGVEVGTELLWDYTQEFNTPTLFVINQIDHDEADYDACLHQAQQRFGRKVLPVQFPLRQGVGFNAIVDALRMVVYVFPDGGGRPEKQPIPESVVGRAQEMHNALVEAAAENDESLMETFFDEGALNEEELAQGLRLAMAQQEIYPVFCCSSQRNMGSGRIMGFINDICPSPVERQPVTLDDGKALLCDSKARPSAFVFKTISEPRVGLVSYFKVYQGVVRPGDELYNPDTNSSERLSQLFLANGADRSPVNALRAGDIGVTVKLKSTRTNHTLNGVGQEQRILPIQFPSPRVRVAVEPLSKNEMEKLMKALHTLEEEDPTLHIEQSAQLNQILLHGQGQLHLDMIRYRMEKVYGLTMHFIRPRISYRETITRAVDTQYRHKKQSGGAGQFAEVHLRVEPYWENMPDPEDLSVRNRDTEELPWGGTLSFYWCIVGGSIDAKYASAIKKGILQKMAKGPLTGSPCQDVRVCVYDGKMHAVDSNDMAFLIAASQAFSHAIQEASPQILEPINGLEVLCQEEATGEVMSDLQGRRAMIMGMDGEGHYQKISAQIPLKELYQYSSTLRSLSQGRAKFEQHFSHFAPVSAEIQQQLIDEFQHPDMAEV